MGFDTVTYMWKVVLRKNGILPEKENNISLVFYTLFLLFTSIMYLILYTEVSKTIAKRSSFQFTINDSKVIRWWYTMTN